ncbi:hypothetical protein CG709_10075 [Lachnotalea glycerini]|nr:hypothetical protein CG709_10075 [Lachnotalea glycerini]
MILVFQFFGDGKLLTRANLNSILNQTVYVAIMAFGAIFVYSHGGMDLSYGGVIGFSVLISILVANTGAPVIVIFITNILAALVWFLLNGMVSVYLKVSPFITSLCIMYMCRGILNTVCATQKYSIPVYLYDYDNQAFKLCMLLGVYLVCYLLFLFIFFFNLILSFCLYYLLIGKIHHHLLHQLKYQDSLLLSPECCSKSLLHIATNHQS